jgi:hypothetical protein
MKLVYLVIIIALMAISSIECTQKPKLDIETATELVSIKFDYPRTNYFSSSCRPDDKSNSNDLPSAFQNIGS